MTNVAILVGNVKYKNLGQLECCQDDVVAVKELLEATEKYSEIVAIQDADADQLKSGIRDVVDKFTTLNEIFFYFTGHGFLMDADFFFCATNFDPRRPNETGLSNEELHSLLKAPNAELVVKVVDACNSGTLLVKAGTDFVSQQKHGLKNLIQIASCLDSQNSLSGNPLSLFTDKFRTAALRKTEGVVYYTDIIETLRDEFLNNNSQTPHFVSQGTGRDQFCDNAKKLENLRTTLGGAAVSDDVRAEEAQLEPNKLSLRDALEAAEAKLVKPDVLESFVSSFFDGLSEKFLSGEFAEYFNSSFIEHGDFLEPSTKEFIVRVMSGEKRSDNFVTADISYETQGNFAGALTQQVARMLSLYGQNSTEIRTLKLNCPMPRAQLKITLKPKFSSLKQLVLVVTCAPSLERCYIFERATQHALKDFETFDPEGTEVVRRWYKCFWSESTRGVVSSISEKLRSIVGEHLDATAKRLNAEE